MMVCCCGFNLRALLHSGCGFQFVIKILFVPKKNFTILHQDEDENIGLHLPSFCLHLEVTSNKVFDDAHNHFLLR